MPALCKSVTESDIRHEVFRGEVVCMQSLRERLGASTGCGGCELAARECLDQALEQKRLRTEPRSDGAAMAAGSALVPNLGELTPA